MSWWQRFIISSAQAFFATLVAASPDTKEKAKPYCVEIYNAIKMAYPGDPEFN